MLSASGRPHSAAAAKTSAARREPVWLRRMALHRDLGRELDRRRHARGEDVDDHVAESILSILRADAVTHHRKLVAKPALVTEPFRRDDDQAVAQVADGLGVVVPEALLDEVSGPASGSPVHSRQLDRNHAASTRSAQTVIDRNSAGPNVVSMATSRASRPRPISTRHTRLALLRGSKVHQRSPSQTSIQAAKSMGSGGIGT